MVLEQIIVTTLPMPEAMARAEQYLATRGFVPASAAANAFPISVDNQATTLQMRRGRKSERGAASVSQLPQQVRLDYEHGRVTIALSIGNVAALSSASQRDKPLQSELLLAIARGLEELLAYGRSGEIHYDQWDSAERQIQDAAKRRTRRNRITLIILLLIVAGLVTLIVVAALASR
jgi:hypothetical protein